LNLLCLVTARGGSKGFPGKNIALLGGCSLVGRSLATLRRFSEAAAPVNTRIFLSTDSETIADEWPIDARPGRLRPPHLASDEASSLDVALYEIQAARSEGFDPDALLLLQPTSPLVDSRDLLAALECFQADCPSILGVVPVDHPVEWTWTLEDDGRLGVRDEAVGASRRQELRTRFRPVGFYLVSTEFLEREQKFILPGVSRGVPVDSSHGIDIDAPLDLALADATLATQAKGTAFPVGAAWIGPGHPCYVIAEAGVNHNGSLDMALELVRKAAEAGADAVKFQTFKAESLVSASAPMAAYQKENLKSDGGQLEMLRKLELTDEQFRQIRAACLSHGIEFISTPFDLESARFLDGMGVPAFKVGSGELTNLPFIHALASLGKPILMSTGMSDMEEVEAAVSTIRAAGDPPLAILHCTSAYPAPPETCNLRAMDSLSKTFAVPVGYSDHTVGWDICLAAVALGATVLEKHFTLDPSLPGPDHRASLDPLQLRTMIQEVRRVESALGSGVKAPVAAELDTRRVARKSLVLARPVPKGGMIREEDLTVKRPGTGIPPSRWRSVVGRRLTVEGTADRVLSWDDLEG